MEPNVGGLDRTARLVVGTLGSLAGVALFLDALPGGPLLGGGLLLVGAVALVTALTRRCPAHRLLGIDTLGRE